MTLRASTHDGTHPRPTMMREDWTSLDGDWGFAHDDADAGLTERWYEPDRSEHFDRTITVPFVPESEASGIHDTGFHPIVWYRRTITAVPTPGRRSLLHLGAVDHEAHVWVDGQLAGHHVGGQTAFTCDLTDLLDAGEEHVVVVRAFDDPHDVELPRGKQDWREQPHGIWYHRSTGIWRSVWLETVPEQHLTSFQWDVDMPRARVDVSLRLAQRPEPGTTVRIALAAGEESLGAVEVAAHDPRVETTVDVPAVRNTQDRDRLLWRPEHPALIDVTLEVLVGGVVVDTAASYLGLRTTGIDRGRFLLNGEPYFVRSVLEQGYWPTSQLTAPSLAAYRQEVELIKELGFTAARIHQKVEDPRFLFWADKLGLLIWGETANAYTYSPRAVAAITAEWTEIVEQVRAHPSVVTWVPMNESWGVRDLADHAPQKDLTIALTALTRALDPSRPVVANDGYEITGGDILALHDYTTDADVLARRYTDEAAVGEVLAGRGPQGRRPIDDAAVALADGAPVMITEFGGVAYAAEGTWGYATVTTAEEFAEKVSGLFAALNGTPVLAGHCYTQLTDTLQEANGLADADRRPKLDPAVIRAFVTGRP
ncbi:glycoside hydrolase family 2 protein [Brachybacterium fresconis]|uniref:Beta-galactosidase/beta-glucuronidase n=1 Tax=Brachybacterium fresconis TaxID=173363 RepID=A0ABS4YH09_9MICO|nr:sugar-binding domain-containing protein [Brachybacterium fresconis]MBP2407682.1 beta-galactosidase/beta-glucuronidase [Brachybacterium fresconis]